MLDDSKYETKNIFIKRTYRFIATDSLIILRNALGVNHAENSITVEGNQSLGKVVLNMVAVMG